MTWTCRCKKLIKAALGLASANDKDARCLDHKPGISLGPSRILFAAAFHQDVVLTAFDSVHFLSTLTKIACCIQGESASSAGEQVGKMA